MPGPKPRLVVVDDNPIFISQLLEQHLRDYFEVEALNIGGEHAPKGVEGLNRVLQQVLKARPDHVLLDCNIPVGGGSKGFLRHLNEGGVLPDGCRIWLISQAPPKDVADFIGEYQQIDGRTQEKLLHKPISARRLRAELTDKTAFGVEVDFWLKFPMPVRILSRQGLVLWHNELWAEPEFPSPDLFHVAENGRLPEVERAAGWILPRSQPAKAATEKKYPYGIKVHSFWLPNGGDVDVLGQVAELQWNDPNEAKFNAALQDAFKSMRQMGYHRGRFYRIHRLAAPDRTSDDEEYDRVVEFVLASYVTLEKDKPHRWPLIGSLKTRVDTQYERTESNRLGIRVGHAEEEQDAHDPVLNELNAALDIWAAGSWLEVPIWVERPEGGGWDIAGCLVFDRHLAKKDRGRAGDAGVDTNQLAVIEDLLGTLVKQLGPELLQRHYQGILHYERTMRALDAKLASTDDERKRFAELVETLCHLCEAKSAILMTADDFGNTLQCKAYYSRESPAALDFMEGVVIPADAGYHPIVQAWRENRTQVQQDFHAAPQRKKLLASLWHAPPPQHLSQMGPEKLTRFTRWVEHDIAGLASIPIALSSQHRIGAITLQYDQPYAITADRHDRMNAVLQRARWVLQRMQDEKERVFWHIILGHEMRSFIKTLRDSVENIGHKKPDVKETDDYSQALLHISGAMDLADTLMDSYKRQASITTESSTPFVPRPHVESYLRLNKYELNARDITVEPDSLVGEGWEVRLGGNAEIFGRVVRVLLGNAIKYSLDSANIELSLKPAREQWGLLIANPGEIRRELIPYLFTMGRPSADEDRSQGGAHMGLAVALRWARHFGGDLTVMNNEKTGMVEAHLLWPREVPDKDFSAPATPAK